MSSVTALTFDRAHHRYEADGVLVPSVTQILRAAGLVDSYDGIPDHILQFAADRSIAVHQASVYYDDNDLDPDSLCLEVAKYVAAWRRFRLEHEFKILASEQMHLGKLNGLQFGMTLDRLIQFAGSNGSGKTTILDIKCTREIHRHHAVQLAGYACGLESVGTPTTRLLLYRRLIVQLKPNATYQLHECTDPSDGDIFAAALQIAHWKMQNS